MLRAGTLPTPLCAGLGEACRLLPDDRAVAEWRSLTLELEAGLQSLFPQMETLGNHEDRHPGHLCVRITGVDAERPVALLQPAVALPSGSACPSGIPQPPHIPRSTGHN